MNQALQSLLSYLRDNWPELLWIVAAAGIASYLASRRARSRWMKRDFLNRLNVSLTSIDDGFLRIRTILEMDCDDVFLNPSASKAVTDYARKTTPESPILPIPKADVWQYLNAVLNEVSERFSEGQLKRDLGVPVVAANYLLCLTCERAGDVRTQKVRCMMVRKELLESLPEEEPSYSSPNHRTRWETLQKLAAALKANPEQFLTIEICL